MSLSEVQKAWLAGFVDGEGCIHYHDKQHPRCDLRIYQKHRKVLDWLQILVGGRVRTHSGVHVLSIHGSNAEQCLKAILPYLRCKQQQARQALFIWRLQRAWPVKCGMARSALQQRAFRFLTDLMCKEKKIDSVVY